MAATQIELPGLGTLEKDPEFAGYFSQGVPMRVLGGETCGVIVIGYDEDPAPGEFEAAIKSFLELDRTALERVEPQVYEFYKDCDASWEAVYGALPPQDRPKRVLIETPAQVWQHVQCGQVTVERRAGGDKAVYVSVDCHCDWEPEHGLQIVFRRGMEVNKVGEANGYLTTSDQFDDPSLENEIYRSV